MLVETAERYIKAIVNKDLEAMEDIFADEIEFFNWNVHAKGKKEALEANRLHICLVKSTKIDILNIIYKEKCVCFETVLAHKYKLNTVDAFDTANVKPSNIEITTSLVFIIEFNNTDKIKSIRTYKLR